MENYSVCAEMNAALVSGNRFPLTAFVRER